MGCICVNITSICYVSDINKNILDSIGKLVRQRREELSYARRDVANMTGLSTNSVAALERGHNTSLNSFLLVCRALQIQPKQVFDQEIELIPLYDLPPESNKRVEVTRRLDRLVHESDFFDTPRRVAEVLKRLEWDKRDSNKFSVYLSGYCKEGALEYITDGNIKRYKKKK